MKDSAGHSLALFTATTYSTFAACISSSSLWNLLAWNASRVSKYMTRQYGASNELEILRALAQGET